MAFTGSIFGVPVNFGADDGTEIAESVIEYLFIHLWIQVADKQIGSNILGSLILRGFVDLDGLAV